MTIGLIDPHDYTSVVKSLREFFDSKGFPEVHTQNRLSILAACEDPTTVATYEYQGDIWPLPQTGQMWLEYELLTKPDLEGCYCVSTSYRQEQNPLPGRHDVIFPMFEFESVGTFDDLIQMEKELLVHLGFNLDGASDLNSMYPSGKYTEVCDKYKVYDLDLTAEHEELLYRDHGDVFFLTHFPFHTSPFWNMKVGKTTVKTGALSNMVMQTTEQEVAMKCDVIIGGMETIGSAERSSDVAEMKHQFQTISDGGYAQLLYDLFGKDRVNLEFFEFLSHNFRPRYGGGIGITRLIAGMKRAGLM